MSQTLQICSSGLNRLKTENEKNERKTESRDRERGRERARKFSSKAIVSGSLVSSSMAEIHDKMVER